MLILHKTSSDFFLFHCSMSEHLPILEQLQSHDRVARWWVAAPRSEKNDSMVSRSVASSGANLAEHVAKQRFRADLFRRLGVVSITLPPLRKRRADIPLLAAHFADRLSAEMGLPPIEFEPSQMEQLRRHDWPGNVRELHDLVEQALLLDHFYYYGVSTL